MNFPFLVLFRMAWIFLRQSDTFLTHGYIPMGISVIRFCFNVVYQFYCWSRWWIQLGILCTTHAFGKALGPYLRYFYGKSLMILDLDTRIRVNKRFRLRRNSGPYHLLTLPAYLCVFSDIHNVHAQDLVLYRNPSVRSHDILYNKLISIWNNYRNDLGTFSPDGWPLRMTLAAVARLAIGSQ